MKPKPLNLRDISEWLEKQIEKRNDMIKYERINPNAPPLRKEIVFITKIRDVLVDEIKQRIKSACEFYLRYKDDPELLWKEHLDYIEKLKAKRRLQQFLTNIREIPSPKGEVSCVHGWDMYDKCKLLKEYNKWLFKLAFGDVFEK